MPDLTTKDALLERMAEATDKLATDVPAKFNEYLPLAGGNMTGNLYHSSSVVKGTAPSSANQPFGSYVFEAGDGTDTKNRLFAISTSCETDNTYGLTFGTYEPIADSTSGIFVRLGNDGNTNKYFRPQPDNTIDLGKSNFRWKQLYAGTGTINTSDERLKDNIAPIPDEVLDAWGDVEWVQYQFKDALKDKGKSARIHIGLIAQGIIKVFAEHGLDALRYGIVCYDAWEANDEMPAGDLYSVRYEEALCLESAYQRRELKRLAERIEAKRSRKK